MLGNVLCHIRVTPYCSVESEGTLTLDPVALCHAKVPVVPSPTSPLAHTHITPKSSELKPG